jgi:hypothetical protein
MGTVRHAVRSPQRDERAARSWVRAPSIRRRFINRARYLKEDRGYRSALGRAIAQWNGEHPAYAILGQPAVPERWQIGPGQWLVYPPQLLTRMRIEGEQLRNARDRDHVDAFWAQERTSEATYQWRQLVCQLCEAWWPQRYFPNWAPLAPYEHPAGPFVSACLLFNLLDVPEAWILDVGPSPIGLRYDPRDLNRTPDAVRDRVLWNGFMQGLDQAIEAGTTITKDVVSRIACAAAPEALRAAHDAYLEQPLYFFYVPAGMNAEEWRALARWCTESGDHSAPGWPGQARKLKREGHSQEAIARLLGIDRRQVRRAISE